MTHLSCLYYHNLKFQKYSFKDKGARGRTRICLQTDGQTDRRTDGRTDERTRGSILGTGGRSLIGTTC